MTIQIYRIKASREQDGQIIDASQAEVLGSAYGRWYADDLSARMAAAEVEDDDAGITAHVTEVGLRVSEVEYDPDYDGEGNAAVTARVDGLDTSWYVTRSEPDGTLSPYGDSPALWVDAEVERRYGQPVAIAIGEEIIARASR